MSLRCPSAFALPCFSRCTAGENSAANQAALKTHSESRDVELYQLPAHAVNIVAARSSAKGLKVHRCVSYYPPQGTGSFSCFQPLLPGRRRRLRQEGGQASSLPAASSKDSGGNEAAGPCVAAKRQRRGKEVGGAQMGGGTPWFSHLRCRWADACIDGKNRFLFE